MLSKYGFEESSKQENAPKFRFSLYLFCFYSPRQKICSEFSLREVTSL